MLSEDHNEGGKDTLLPKQRGSKRITAFSHFLIGVGVFLVLLMILSAVGAALVALKDGISIEEASTALASIKDAGSLRLINFVSMSLSMFLAAYLTPRFFGIRSWVMIPMTTFPKGKMWLLSIGIFVVSIPVVSFLLEWSQTLDYSFLSSGLKLKLENLEAQNNAMYELLMGDRSTTDFLLNLFFMALAPALTEEFLFRGYFLRTIFGVTKNTHAAVWLSSLLFAVMHLQFLKLVPMVLMGVVFGYLVIYTRSIWPSIVLHFTNNAYTLYYLNYETSGSYSEVTAEGSGLAFYLVLICMLLLPFGMLYLHRTSSSTLNNIYE